MNPVTAIYNEISDKLQTVDRLQTVNGVLRVRWWNQQAATRQEGASINIPYPCAFIEFANIDFIDRLQHASSGEATVTIHYIDKLVLDQFSLPEKMLDLAQAGFIALNGVRAQAFSSIKRINEQIDHSADQIHHYTQDYIIEFLDTEGDIRSKLIESTITGIEIEKEII